MLSFPSISTKVPPTLLSVEERFHRALDDMRLGRPVILVDDFDRENEADLIAAAETISVPTMALFIREGSGIVCLCLADETLDRLDLPQMVSTNESCYQTAFTVTIDAREGVTTGVSAQDRVTTIRAAVGLNAQPARSRSPRTRLPPESGTRRRISSSRPYGGFGRFSSDGGNEAGCCSLRNHKSGRNHGEGPRSRSVCQKTWVGDVEHC